MKPLLLAMACAIAAPTFAQTAEPAAGPSAANREIPEVTIIGSRGDVKDLPGSATVITGEDIAKFNQTDIQRIIRSVPGVSVQIEDGYGLRPNLSIRGTQAERSSRITLLEDNILIAPAPYSAPAAYYFPTAGRLAGVEVLKGPAAISQGPYTTGGAINLLSTPIPVERSGLLELQTGQDATNRLHTYYGADEDRVGWLVETHQWESDGYQNLDSGGDTGFDKQDYMTKLRISSDPDADIYQALDLKLQYAKEDSQQSYLGLTDADFDSRAERRYGASARDDFDSRHKQAVLRYSIDTDNFEAWVAAYYNDFSRDWFKTEKLDIDGSGSAASFSGTSWFNVIQEINNSVPGQAPLADEYNAILNGADTAAGAILLRSNNREYYSKGIETAARWNVAWAGAQHTVSGGLRLHSDQEDRLQRDSTYTQLNGALLLDDLGVKGNAGNSQQNADVWAVWIRDDIQVGKLTVSPGIRFEYIDMNVKVWETRSGETTDPASRASENVREKASDDTKVWLPGLGVLYEFDDRWSAYGGVHKGFSAPNVKSDVDEEDSVNYELGLRFNNDTLSTDAALFYTDYDNLVGICTNSSGVVCDFGELFNGDKASVVGLEVSATKNFGMGDTWNFPVQVTYTYTDGQFDGDDADPEFFGSIEDGSPLPYIPDNQGIVSMGAESTRWGGYLSMNYVDETCVRASCGDFEKTDALLTFDSSAYFNIGERITLTATLENLLDDDSIAARTPYGARSNKPRTAMVGFRVAL